MRGGTGALRALGGGSGGGGSRGGGSGAAAAPSSPQHAHPPVSKELAAALAAAPRFLLLDFRGVRGVDATAVAGAATNGLRIPQ